MKDDDPTAGAWRRVSALLDELLDLDPEDRPAALRAACQDEPELVARIERLLLADERHEGILEQPPEEVFRQLLDDAAAAGPCEGQVEGCVIGPYRIVREIGRGGMGVIYLAQRADGQFEQRVALKLLKRGLDTGEIMDRFLRERQILARLEHPAIARLLDGGVSEEGQPYFAMEYVDGKPITIACDGSRATVEERLKLFVAVCEGVQYAHANLVIHRDLKPSNIMVDAEGRPKLLDFGIAKLLSDEGTAEATALTRAGRSAMTPEYAAPEQIRGEPATTATDVYALGLVLYELLTGRRARQLEGSSSPAPTGASPGTRPKRPSLVVASRDETESDGDASALAVAASRRSSPRRLRRRLAGDLDTIVLKALREEPGRRYPSVEALARDVERHIEGLPVKARRETWTYRAGKLISRHRLGFAATVALVLALAGGLAATAWEARAAAREAHRAEAVTRFLVSIFETSDPAKARGRTVSARELLDRGTGRIDSELSGQPVAQAELRGVLGELYRKLGLLDRAGPLLNRALQDNRAIYGVRSTEAAAAEERWGVYLYDRGKYVQAEKVLRHVLALQEEVSGPHSPAAGETLSSLASTLSEQGRYAEAAGLHRRALDISTARFGGESTQAATDLANLAVTLWNRGELDAAEPYARRALAIRERRLGEDHPETAESLHDVATLLSDKGDYEESEALFKRAIRLRKRILGPDHPLLATTLSNYAILLQRRGRMKEAKPVALDALEIDRQALGPDHPTLAVKLNNYGVLCYRLGDFEEAERFMGEALETWRTQLGPEHPKVATALNNIGMIRLELGDAHGAELLIREGLAIHRRTSGDVSRPVARSLRNLGVALLAEGRTSEAGRDLSESLDVSRRVYPEGYPRLAEVEVALARVRMEQRRLLEAEALLRTARAIRAEKMGADDPRTAETELYLGLCRAAQGHPAEARTLLTHGLSVPVRRRRESHRLAGRARSVLAGL